MTTGGYFVGKKCSLIIQNGEICDQKLFLDIHNGRHWPFCEIKWPILY